MNNPPVSSPKWGPSTKLVVAIAFLAAIAGLLIKFQALLGPLLLSFILSYLIYPLATRAQRWLHLSWRLSVTLFYLIIVILLLGLLALSGVTLVQQIQSLINFLNNAITHLPSFITGITAHPLMVGPFPIDLTHLDLATLTNQALNIIQPLLSQVGSLAGTLAASAATSIAWLSFILFLSYFILAETGGARERLIHFYLPGYNEDFARLGFELGKIWNAFLRGQVIIMSLSVLIYIGLLGAMGVHYFYILAFLAGLARFVPYIGPFIAWSTYGLVSYFQGTTIFGLSSFSYAGLVILIAWLTDAIIDNLISPRILADALKVHPAAVMVAALVGLDLFGLAGMILAAPILATASLFLDYTTRKIFDQDPWAGRSTNAFRTTQMPLILSLREWFGKRICQFKKPVKVPKQ